jgi:galactoside O-acetyltransferase
MITRLKNVIKAYYSKKKVQKIIAAGYMTIDPSVIVLPAANFDFRATRGDGVKIEIAEYSIIGCNFVFESKKGHISIGKRTFINSGTNLISCNEIIIGNDVTIAWNCTIYDHNAHSIDWNKRKSDIMDVFKYGQKHYMEYKNWDVVKSRPILIQDKTWIGFGCIILNGVTIGEGAIVSAGSVVREDVAPWTIVAGNPAVVIKKIDRRE